LVVKVTTRVDGRRSEMFAISMWDLALVMARPLPGNRDDPTLQLQFVQRCGIVGTDIYFTGVSLEPARRREVKVSRDCASMMLQLPLSFTSGMYQSKLHRYTYSLLPHTSGSREPFQASLVSIRSTQGQIMRWVIRQCELCLLLTSVVCDCMCQHAAGIVFTTTRLLRFTTCVCKFVFTK
jgi:hypothetical protein